MKMFLIQHNRFLKYFKWLYTCNLNWSNSLRNAILQNIFLPVSMHLAWFGLQAEEANRKISSLLKPASMFTVLKHSKSQYSFISLKYSQQYILFMIRLQKPCFQNFSWIIMMRSNVNNSLENDYLTNPVLSSSWEK